MCYIIFANNPLKTKYMKTGFIFLTLGILGFLATPIYWLFDTEPFGDIQITVMYIFVLIAVFGISLVQNNSAPRKISKNRNILGLITAVVGILFALWLPVPPVLIFCICVTMVFLGIVVSGAFIPQPLNKY